MSADHSDTNDPQLEDLLRRAAPGPSARFEADLERRLFSARPSRARRPAFAGLLGASGGLALVVVVAGLVGGGPLAIHGGEDAKARPGCTTVYVTTVEPSGEVVRKADGTVTVETSDKPVTRARERCR